jgi:hypothetical protein
VLNLETDRRFLRTKSLVRIGQKAAPGTLRSIDDTPRDLDICDIKASKGEH